MPFCSLSSGCFEGPFFLVVYPAAFCVFWCLSVWGCFDFCIMFFCVITTTTGLSLWLPWGTIQSMCSHFSDPSNAVCLGLSAAELASASPCSRILSVVSCSWIVVILVRGAKSGSTYVAILVISLSLNTFLNLGERKGNVTATRKGVKENQEKSIIVILKWKHIHMRISN